MNHRIKLAVAVLGLGLAILPGCGKSSPPPAQTFGGVTVDMPKLRQALATAPAEVQNQLSEVTAHLRYGDYAKLVAALEKLSNSPGLTDEQKKAIAQVTDQAKQLASAPPKPAQ